MAATVSNAWRTLLPESMLTDAPVLADMLTRMLERGPVTLTLSPLGGIIVDHHPPTNDESAAHPEG